MKAYVPEGVYVVCLAGCKLVTRDLRFFQLDQEFHSVLVDERRPGILVEAERRVNAMRNSIPGVKDMAVQYVCWYNAKKRGVALLMGPIFPERSLKEHQENILQEDRTVEALWKIVSEAGFEMSKDVLVVYHSIKYGQLNNVRAEEHWCSLKEGLSWDGTKTPIVK